MSDDALTIAMRLHVVKDIESLLGRGEQRRAIKGTILVDALMPEEVQAAQSLLSNAFWIVPAAKAFLESQIGSEISVEGAPSGPDPAPRRDGSPGVPPSARAPHSYKEGR